MTEPSKDQWDGGLLGVVRPDTPAKRRHARRTMATAFWIFTVLFAIQVLGGNLLGALCGLLLMAFCGRLYARVR